MGVNGNLESMWARQERDFTEKMNRASLVIFGSGGLGSNIANMIVRSGLGKLYIFDYDKVEITNLNRQNYDLGDLGRDKLEATKEKLLKINPKLDISIRKLKVDRENIGDILKLSNIFVEALDGETDKAMLFDVFSSLDDKYLVSASGISGIRDFLDIRVKRFGNISIFGDFKSSEGLGLYSPKVNLYASLQALEVLNIIDKIY